MPWGIEADGVAKGLIDGVVADDDVGVCQHLSLRIETRELYAQSDKESEGCRYRRDNPYLGEAAGTRIGRHTEACIDGMLVLTGGLGELMFKGVHIVGVLVVIYGLVYAVAI